MQKSRKFKHSLSVSFSLSSLFLVFGDTVFFPFLSAFVTKTLDSTSFRDCQDLHQARSDNSSNRTEALPFKAQRILGSVRQRRVGSPKTPCQAVQRHTDLRQVSKYPLLETQKPHLDYMLYLHHPHPKTERHRQGANLEICRTTRSGSLARDLPHIRPGPLT